MKLITYILGFFRKKQKQVFITPDAEDTRETFLRRLIGLEPVSRLGESNIGYKEEPKMELAFIITSGYTDSDFAEIITKELGIFPDRDFEQIKLQNLELDKRLYQQVSKDNINI